MIKMKVMWRWRNDKYGVERRSSKVAMAGLISWVKVDQVLKQVIKVNNPYDF